jgi:hypothetical protein
LSPKPLAYLRFSPLVGILTLALAGCVGDPAATAAATSPPTSAAASPSQKSQPSFDPAAEKAKRDNTDVCSDMTTAYTRLRGNTTVIVDVSTAADAGTDKARSAAAALRALLTVYEARLLANQPKAHDAKLVVALGFDQLDAKTLIKQLDQAGGNGTKVSAIPLTREWKELGQRWLIACRDLR